MIVARNGSIWGHVPSLKSAALHDKLTIEGTIKL
jgi:hypothetical protein